MVIIAATYWLFPGLLACYSGVEDDVPRACNIKLSPECVGENRADRQPVHPPLRSVPRDTHLRGPTLVAQVVRPKEICIPVAEKKILLALTAPSGQWF
jgi:hypothetical protein